MILNRHLRALLRRLGIGERLPPTAPQWVALLSYLNDHFRVSEEEKHRLTRSLEIHGREVQSLYKELVQEREKLSSALACLTIGFVIFDKNGQVSLMNAEAEQYLGWSESEGMQRNLLQHLGLEDPARPGVLAQHLASGQSLDQRRVLRTKSGQPFDTQVQIQPVLRDGNLMGSVLTFETPEWRLAAGPATEESLQELLETFLAKAGAWLENDCSAEMQFHLQTVVNRAEEALAAASGGLDLGASSTREDFPAVLSPVLETVSAMPVEGPPSSREGGGGGWGDEARFAVSTSKASLSTDEVQAPESLRAASLPKSPPALTPPEVYPTEPRYPHPVSVSSVEPPAPALPHAPVSTQSGRSLSPFFEAPSQPKPTPPVAEEYPSRKSVEALPRAEMIAPAGPEQLPPVGEPEVSPVVLAQPGRGPEEASVSVSYSSQIPLAPLRAPGGDLPAVTVLAKAPSPQKASPVLSEDAPPAEIPKPPTPPKIEPRPASPKVQELPLRVLLVEDEPVSQLVTQSHLEKLGHECVVAGDANEAIRLYQRQQFDAIISSYLMPGMNGIDLCRKIREDSRGGYSYFILLTAVERKEEAARALEAGVDAFLTKPLDPNELAVRLKVARGVQSRLSRVYSDAPNPE